MARSASLFMALALALALALAAACSPGDPDEFEDGIGGGKGDDATEATGATRLDRATPEEVTTEFVADMSAELDQCFAAYRDEFDADAVMVTEAVISRFISVNSQICDRHWDLEEVLRGVLAANDRVRAYPDELKEWMPEWTLQQLEPATVSGYVQDENLPSLFSWTVGEVRTANAIAREKDPTGIDLEGIRTTWGELASETNLDSDYLNPVLFGAEVLESAEIFAALRAHFPIQFLSVSSTGRAAVDAFWNAGDGPEGDPAFADIATKFKLSSIRKRFYFSGSVGSSWTSNVLIVIDEHSQAYGLQMGYSE